MKIKLKSFFFLLVSFFALNAKTEGTAINGNPYESWNSSRRDFFVMFNSNIDNKYYFLNEDIYNPQGDSCIPNSFFNLDDYHIPNDAVIEKAYLIWMGAVDPSKLSDPVDNSVKLKFIQESVTTPVIYEETITSGTEGKFLTDENNFNFESLYFQNDVINGCTEIESGTLVSDQYLGYFTYRMDVTSFFDKISLLNADNGNSESGQYYGTYIFSNLDCTEHDNYRCNSTMVSAWAVLMIYRSQNVGITNIYLYNGLSFVQGDRSTANVSGFELSKNPIIRLTSMIAEGDSNLVDPAIPYSEGILLRGEDAPSLYYINNECNSLEGNYVEAFNSMSSVANWNTDAEDKIKCIGGSKDDWVNYGIDVDTFILNKNNDINLFEHLKNGDTCLDISFSVNKDEILTNFLILSIDNNNPEIPDNDQHNDDDSDNDSINDIDYDVDDDDMNNDPDNDNMDDNPDDNDMNDNDIIYDNDINDNNSENNDEDRDETSTDIDNTDEKTDNINNNDDSDSVSYFSDSDSNSSSGCSCNLIF